MSKEQAAVCRLSEIKDGEMKQVSAGETPIVIARVNGECHAVAAHCTHYGAPLADGYLDGDRIICPWHHACFSAATGEVLEPPAFDHLQKYPLRIEGDEIFVDVDAGMPDRREPEWNRDERPDERKFAIIGGGAAAYYAAQTLRETGFSGRVVMFTKEERRPYDRPNLSKDYLQGNAEPAWMPLRPDDFYKNFEIEVRAGMNAVSVDRDGKKIRFENGEEFAYDKLLIATGGVPRKLEVPGSDLKNVFVLRSFDSADDIIAAADAAKNIAVIGASFIAMEAAASLRKRGKAVTVIAPDKVPFERVFGQEIGQMFKSVHESNGMRFRLGEGVAGFEGDGAVQRIVLSNGEKVDADLAVVGIGVMPATNFLEGFEKHKDGGLITDKFLQAADDVFAAGDIVHYPDPRTGAPVRIEHWRIAEQQGRTAAKNMMRQLFAFDSVPFFWTTQFDATLNYVGHAREWDEIRFDGDPAAQEFTALYIKDGKVMAAAGMNRDREIAEWEARFAKNEAVPADGAAGSAKS